MIQQQFNMKKINTKPFSDGTAMIQVQLYRKNKKSITYDDVSKLTKYFNDEAQKKGKPYKLGIRALAIDQWKTLKGMDADELMSEEDYDEYFVNKVSDTFKFSKFEQVQIYIIK